MEKDRGWRQGTSMKGKVQIAAGDGKKLLVSFLFISRVYFVQHRSFSDAGQEVSVEEEEERLLKWPTNRGRRAML